MVNMLQIVAFLANANFHFTVTVTSKHDKNTSELITTVHLYF
jgi:hypothetical protein